MVQPLVAVPQQGADTDAEAYPGQPGDTDHGCTGYDYGACSGQG